MENTQQDQHTAPFWQTVRKRFSQNKKILSLLLLVFFFGSVGIYFLSQGQAKTTGFVPGKILEVQLSFNNKSENAGLTLDAYAVKNGGVPFTDEATADSLTLRTLGKDGTVLASIPFTIPDEVSAHTAPLHQMGATRPQPEQEPEHVIINSGRFAINLPWDTDARKLEIISEDGDLVTSKDISTVATIDNPATFSTLTQSGSKLTITSTPAARNAARSTANKRLDIAIIGDNYNHSQLKNFRKLALEYATYAQTVEPLKSRAQQISFHIINNTTSLGCEYKYHRSHICSSEKVVAKVNDSGAPYDKIMVVVDSKHFSGTTFPSDNIATMSPGNEPYLREYDEETFLHEIGHLAFRLADEYLVGFEEYNMVNCSTSATVPAKWRAVVAPGDYKKGCGTKKYYRSSPSSMMKSQYDYPWFNAVSQEQINKKMDLYAGPYVDNESPTVSLVSPSNHAALTKTAIIKVRATDNSGISRIELWKNGKLFKTEYKGIDEDGNYSLTWNTIRETNGAYDIAVKVFDSSNNSASTENITVDIDNVADTTPPSGVEMLIYKDTDNYNQLRRVEFSVDVETWKAAEDSGRLSRVELYVNEKLVDSFETNSSLGAPLSYWDEISLLWSSKRYKDGDYQLTLKAYDPSGNVFTTPPETVRVDNTDTGAPEAIIKRPLAGTKLSSDRTQFKIAASASDNAAIATVVLRLDGVAQKTCQVATGDSGPQLATCAATIQTDTLNKGRHIISIVAIDIHGNRTAQRAIITK